MKPTAIITSDIGLQEGQPICRLDDYWAAQGYKLAWLKALQEEYDVPILDAGDLFEHWKPSPYLLKWALENLPDGIITIPGNHDLPAHNLDLYEKSGLAVLEAAGKIEVLKQDDVKDMNHEVFVYSFPWGMETTGLSESRRPDVCHVALVHTMTYIGRSYPGCKDPGALQLLKKMEGFDLIIVGHNHQHFMVNYKDRKLISPGSLTRTTADQIDYQPNVFLWYADTNDIVPVPVPIEKGVISREHIDSAAQKDERIEAFVSRLSDEMEIGLSFEQNLENYFSTHRSRQGVKDIVWGAVR